MSKQENESNVLAATQQSNEVLKKLGKELPQERIAWLAGYFAGQAEVNQKLADLFHSFNGNGQLAEVLPTEGSPVKVEPQPKLVAEKTLTILYGSHSGNGSGFAKQAKEIAEQKGYKIQLKNMADYKVRDLKKEKNLLIIVSTHGEGVPPFAAEELYEYIHNDKASQLADLQYSVLALGDRSYFHFCKTGIDFDTRLEALGAKRIYQRVDCDVNFKLDAGNWLAGSLQALDALYSDGETKIAASSGLSVTKEEASVYDEENPFEAEIIKKVKLNGRGSNQETYHIELSLEGSGIQYKPGDAVAVKASNSDELVRNILETTVLTGNEKVQTKNARVDLKDVLKNDLELTTLSSDIVRKHAEKSGNEELNEVVNDLEKFKELVATNDVLDLFQNYPAEYKPQELVDLLRPLSARLYSISSSLAAYEEELHLTVGAVRYNNNGRNKEGVCSTFFADRLEEGDKVSIYIRPNEGFRLPEKSTTPVIMVGAGTGIAPYRAFVDERATWDDASENWLVFGNQYFATDFLYQTEWLNHLKTGALSKMDVAFSRDQEEKIYVQHKILQNSKEVYEWLEKGANVYVCGDKNHMAADVYKAFVEVVQKEGALNSNEAEEYLKNLKRKGKYQEDVY